jgi:GTP-binding protein HflX
VQSHEATLVVFDCELSGTQQKILERTIGCRVLDRTAIILDIFSRHARTKEAKTRWKWPASSICPVT